MTKLLKRWVKEDEDEAGGGEEADGLELPRPPNDEHADRKASAATTPIPPAHARALLRGRIVPSVPVAVLYRPNHGVPKAALRRHATPAATPDRVRGRLSPGYAL